MKKRLALLLATAIVVLGIPGGLLGWERQSGKGASLLRSQVQTVISPFSHPVRWAAIRLSNGLEYIVTSGLVRKENNLMRQRVARLEAENSFLRESLAKYERLNRGAALGEIGHWQLIQADVIAMGSRRWARSLTIRRDSDSRIRVGSPVVHLNGLAGCVVSASKSYATVQLLSDAQSAVGVIVLPGRARGVVRGTGDTDKLELLLEDPTVGLQKGQQIISSGMQDSLYPKGLPIGRVGDLRRNRFGQTIAEVVPAVQFKYIEEVLVLDNGQASAKAESESAGGTTQR